MTIEGDVVEEASPLRGLFPAGISHRMLDFAEQEQLGTVLLASTNPLAEPKIVPNEIRFVLVVFYWQRRRRCC